MKPKPKATDENRIGLVFSDQYIRERMERGEIQQTQQQEKGNQ